MNTSRAIKGLALIGAAVGIAVGVAIGVALLSHELLVATIGEDGILAIDDTPKMMALVAATYGSGALAGLVVLVIGWRRFLRSKG